MNTYLAFGRSLTCGELAELAGVSRDAMEARLRKGMSPEAAVRPLLSKSGPRSLNGKRFGALVVILESCDECQCWCECGAQPRVHRDNLRNGSVTSCGCGAKAPPLPTRLPLLPGAPPKTYRVDGKDLRLHELAALAGVPPSSMHWRLRRGMSPEEAVARPQAQRAAHDSVLLNRRFGRLVVVAKSDKGPQGGQRWECKCDCGASFTTSRGTLLSGGATSCGCAKRERIGAMATARFKDPTGQDFHGVRVLGRSDEDRPRADGWRVPLWNCLCPCGKTFTTSAASLRRGQRSCGCKKWVAAGGALNAMAKRIDVFGCQMTMAELSKLSGRSKQSILYRMAHLNMSPGQAAFSPRLRQ